jgi:hypothetical protein
MCRVGSIVGLGIYPYFQMSVILGFLASGIVGERLYYFVSLIIFSIVAVLARRLALINPSALKPLLFNQE